MEALVKAKRKRPISSKVEEVEEEPLKGIDPVMRILKILHEEVERADHSEMHQQLLLFAIFNLAKVAEDIRARVH